MQKLFKIRTIDFGNKLGFKSFNTKIVVLNHLGKLLLILYFAKNLSINVFENGVSIPMCIFGSLILIMKRAFLSKS